MLETSKSNILYGLYMLKEKRPNCRNAIVHQIDRKERQNERKRAGGEMDGSFSKWGEKKKLPPISLKAIRLKQSTGPCVCSTYYADAMLYIYVYLHIHQTAGWNRKGVSWWTTSALTTSFNTKSRHEFSLFAFRFWKMSFFVFRVREGLEQNKSQTKIT